MTAMTSAVRRLVRAEGLEAAHAGRMEMRTRRRVHSRMHQPPGILQRLLTSPAVPP